MTALDPKVSTPRSAEAGRSVLVLGATGTIGQATVRALLGQGFRVVCLVRSYQRAVERFGDLAGLPLALRQTDVENPGMADEQAFSGEAFCAVISCLASRSGTPADAELVDRHAQIAAIQATARAGIPHFILLSALCVQKPRLAFQHAKLAAEAALQASGLRYSIIRPTAFFKSLSGQLDRLRRGKPFLLFGDGTLTRCKPISDDDLAAFLVACIDQPACWNRILPIGGPGPALTPLEQGQLLFEALGLPPRFRQVPVGLMDAIVQGLALGGRIVPHLAGKAELVRIGRYYATESMLVWDDRRQCYDAEATPSAGKETLSDFYRRLARGEARVERGEHAVF